MKRDYAMCLQIAYNFTNAVKKFYSGNNAIFQ